ncbi:MAG: hypothetical protein WKG01_02055 [Kofleriaceae bacterium]
MRPGIVHLRDLAHRYMWNARAIEPFVVATELAIEPLPAWRAFVPPRVLVLIVHHDDHGLLARSRPWLGDCEHLILVRDCRGDLIADDPALAALIEEEWQRELASLPAHVVVDWHDPEQCHEALALAIARADALPAVAPPPVPVSPDLELPMSSWVGFTSDCFRSHWIANARLVLDGEPVLVDSRGTRLSLAAPREPIHLTWTPDELGPPLPAQAHGPDHHPGMWRYGRDPIHPVGWRGSRMAVYWSYVTDRETGFLSATDHDYPSGPAKKLWGFEDNDPVSVAVTPAADACVQRFGHDVTVLDVVPIAWHRAGAVDVAAFVRDPRRATFYAQTADFAHDRATDDLTDEDNRELAPVIVLGPSPAVRYAVGLLHRVVRVSNQDDTAVADVIGGPDEGFAVFDRDHQLVRRGTGILLGGWFRHATIEDAGSLWREDLATGERVLLGSAARVACIDPDVEAVVQDAIREGRHDAAAALRAAHPTRPIDGALEVVAIPGTRNILEIGAQILRVV